MPRSKPNEVITHRIELGGWERDKIKEAEMIAAVSVLSPAIGIGAAGLGIGLAGYAAYKWLQDNAGAIKWVAEADDWIWGKKNPLLQIIPNIGWLRGSDFSAWF